MSGTDPERDPGVAQIHDLLRSALVEIDRVLSPTGCRYFLAYGTALGARRHAGFVPWDVDADLYLHADDRPRALEALRTGLTGTPFAVQRPGDPGYEYLFPRVVLRGVHHTLIRVDLFPLEVAPDAAWLRRLLTALLRTTGKLHMLKAMDLAERRHYDRRKAAVARAAKAVLSVVPLGVIAAAHRALVAAARRGGSGATLVNSSGSYGAREYFPAPWFAGRVTLDLEGHAFPVPAPVDDYLTHVYGDFQSPPTPAQVMAELAFAREHYVEPLRSAGVLR
ncbi:LicD family protein [Aeromicrobium sp. Marseille-Q0843]|uniref:LicD family protein n=1 Tax=Aeromicrobium phoceense TaxID=2754045 RepID=A0A838XFN7_9ACTN|nr:LicD family protein [Aeromicrobium phoceense]MBA4607588.1 LicD family protein [Aeromicrobium phoceense]